MKLTIVTMKQFSSLNLLNGVQMNTKDLPRTAIVLRIKFQNTVEKLIANSAGFRIKFLTGKVR